MKKYLIEKLWIFEYDYDMAVVKELKNNDKKWKKILKLEKNM